MSRSSFVNRTQSVRGLIPAQNRNGTVLAYWAILIFALCGVLVDPPWIASGTKQSAAEPRPEPPHKPDPTFDGMVRGDMFAGMAGDQESFQRAMKLCEDTLARNPDHAEALAWHGAGLVWESGQVFLTGNIKRGKEFTIQGHAEMDKAVALLPNSVTVLIPRGATDLETSKHIHIPEFAQRMLEQGLGDYEKVLKLQQPQFNSLPTHSRGELLSGLAEGWYRAGNSAVARKYAQRTVSDLPGSAYATRSRAFLDQSPQAGVQLDWHCLGCHR
jgi:hypothetical protein